jgi:uncharacterized protein YecE (DUF72 family)
MAATIRIGISGWRYGPWRGVFYPEELPQRAELAYASRQVPTIEINGSFYSLQRPESYSQWHDATPDDFVFAVKGGRYITHLKRLRNVESALANFFASGVLRLEKKLGPILWQLPPSSKFDADRLAAFFALLPRTTRDAAELAARHDAWMRGRVWFDVRESQPLRHALEVRHPSFETPDFIRLLRQHDIALVVADTAGKWPFLEDVTADFVYVRLHGDEELYASGYSDSALASWAKKIAAWSRGTEAPGVRTLGPAASRRAAGRDVYVYFDNDVKVRAPFDAMTLAHQLRLRPPADQAAPDPATIAEKPRTVWPAWQRPLQARPKSTATTPAPWRKAARAKART